MLVGKTIKTCCREGTITDKPPIFGVDKWLEAQNIKLACTFNAAIRKLEYIFRKEAQQQVEAFMQNAMADYKELWELRDHSKRYLP